MNIKAQVKAYQLLEHLLSNGHTMVTLPIDKERAKGILDCRIEATKQDLKLLEDAGR